jgi:plasmid replication initiation protein
MNNLIVTKSNKIVEASYKLNLNEQRLVLAYISKLNPAEKIKDGSFTITVKEFVEFFGVDDKKAYEIIDIAVNNLAERWIYINQEDPETGETVTKTRWISDMTYSRKDASKVKMTFAPKVIPYLTSLNKEFTSYRLQNVVKLTSTYSIRLYEMLVQWRKIGKVTFKVDSLRKSLGVEEGEYKRMSNFKMRVLDFAVKQINDFTDINCNYVDIKTGRSITAFEFRFGENASTQDEFKEVLEEIQMFH